ncbi:hypothetical protein FHS85_005226 [Rhodoligotrophos appendicifer]
MNRLVLSLDPTGSNPFRPASSSQGAVIDDASPAFSRSVGLTP